MVNGFVYRAFLVLMTTQSALQYSFYIHSVTHTFIQCIYWQHFVVLWGTIRGSASCSRTHADVLGRLGIKLPTFRLEDDHSNPSAIAAPWHESKHKYIGIWDIVWLNNTFIFLYFSFAVMKQLQSDVSGSLSEIVVQFRLDCCWLKSLLDIVRKKIKWIITSHLKAWTCSAYPCNASLHSTLSYPRGLERWN